MNRSVSSGAVNPWLIVSIVTIMTTLILAGFSIWAYMQYVDQRDNVDAKVAVAVAEAVKERADADAAKFEELEKLPTRTFVGPDDYGRLQFAYPKTWSVFVQRDASNGGNYEAYLNPVAVPPISNTQQYALRVLIENRDYDQVLNTYQPAVQRGDLSSQAVKAGDVDGTRLDGAFSRDIRGSAVLFKIRDKTVTIRSDAETFRGDFDALIGTISFNQ